MSANQTYPPSLLMIAGEASADAHGARVLSVFKQQHSNVEVWGVGGPAMRDAGLHAVANAESISTGGLTEVIFSLPRILTILRRIVRLAYQRKPVVALLIDLPDFNLRLARKLKKFGIPVVYFISPQIWAWRRGRVKHIRRVVDKMLVVFPFEQEFYSQHNVNSIFVGHPLVEALNEEIAFRPETRKRFGIPIEANPVIALLPGSRPKEVIRHLPHMIKSILMLRRYFPESYAVIPIASTIPETLVQKYIPADIKQLTLLKGHATEALIASDIAVVCSGTATLQAALLKRPMVVVYRVSWLSYHILKRLIKVAHIALVNLILNKKLVPELIQYAFTPASLVKELKALLENEGRQKKISDGFQLIRHHLGEHKSSHMVVKVLTEYMPSRLSSRSNSQEANF